MMIRTKLMASALAFVVLLAGTSATAQEPVNQITYFSFSAPFELPGGKTLPAGKYVFKIVDSPSNRHIIHVMSEDQTEMHATVMAIPAQRMEAANEPEVRFMEAEASAAPAIRTWWYPGRTIGHEFIYPKDQARRLAARQSEGVLTVNDEATTAEQMRTAELSRVGADGREGAVETERAVESASAQATAEREATQSSRAQPMTPEPTSLREADTTRPDATAAEASERTELSRTASPLPLFALLGAAALRVGR